MAIPSASLSSASHICDAMGAVCPKRMRRKDARPGELLAAALDLFVEKGFAATRVEEVAQRAGVSKGTLFLYFSSKEELFKAVVRESISGRISQWSEGLEAYVGSSEAMLRDYLQQWWQHIGATKAAGISKLMISEARNFPELAQFYHAEVVQPCMDLLQRILRRGVQRGEFKRLDESVAAYAILAQMVFMNVWRHSFGLCASAELAGDPQRYMEMQLAILLHGLLAPASASASAHTANPLQTATADTDTHTNTDTDTPPSAHTSTPPSAKSTVRTA